MWIGNNLYENIFIFKQVSKYCEYSAFNRYTLYIVSIALLNWYTLYIKISHPRVTSYTQIDKHIKIYLSVRHYI